MIDTVPILLVEDNASDAAMVRRELEKITTADFQITHAQTLGEAKRSMDGRHFEIILLDLGLPDSQGVETFREVRANAGHTPIIVMSGSPVGDVSGVAAAAGAKDYLIKGTQSRPLGYAIERWRFESNAAAHGRQQLSAATLGQLALSGAGIEELLRESVRLVCNALCTESCEILEHRPRSGEMLLRAAAGRRERMAGSTYTRIPREVLLAFEREGSHMIPLTPSISECLEIEVGSTGMLVFIHGRASFWGIMVAQTAKARVFARHEVAFLETIAHILRQSIDEKLSQEQLRRHQAMLSAAVRIGQLGSWEYDIAEERLDWSEETFKIFGVDRQNFGGSLKDFYEAVHPVDRAGIIATMTQAATEGGPVELEYRVIRPDGQVRTVFGRNEVVFDANRKATRKTGMIVDITERRLAEWQLRESEERFRQLAENIRLVFWMTNPAKQTMLYVSPAYELIWGRTCQSLYEDPTSWINAIHVEDRGRITAALPSQLIGGYDETYRIIRTDGTIRWIRDRAFPVKNGDGEVYRIVGNAEDVTEQALARQRISRQAALIDYTSDAILVKDLDGNILFWNRGAERMYGWSSEEALGQSAVELLGVDRRLFEEAKVAVMEKGEWHGEMAKRGRGGRNICVNVRWTRVPEHDGGTAIMAINTDITEKKKLEADFLRAQRMESIGTLAGGIAHDLNNVLAPIMMSVELLKDAANGDESKSLLATVETSVKRGAELVRQVLSFARGVEGKRGNINVMHIAREVERIVRDTFPRNIAMHTDGPHDLRTVHADATQLHQVLMNLCVNARDAMPNGGRLTLKAANSEVDRLYADMHPEAAPGKYITIEIADTGTGIPAQVRAKIFEPFFTTKEAGKGTGLGLSTTLTIVKSHGGFIEVYSEEGKGATFKIFLPAHPEAAGAASTGENFPHLPHGKGELILVIDDEESIRRITRKVLERANYRVLDATNGATAVAEYAKYGSEIAVVLTDMAMPVMDGPATILALRTLNANLPIVASTGQAEGAESIFAMGAPVDAFIPKPYTADSLINTLDKVLHGSQRR